MKKIVASIFAGLIGVSLLAGCGHTEKGVPELSVSTTDTSAVSTTDTSAETKATEPASTANFTTASTKTESTTAETTRETEKTSANTTIEKTTTTKKVTTKKQTKPSKSTSTTEKATTIATPDPNRTTINGKEYAVGDTIRYTVMVKTSKNYGTVKVGIQCLQKGLEIPDGTFQKQNQYVMKNIGIGRLGTMPEETIGNNGFAMTVNKGYALDFTAGNSGLLWYYETTNYDYSAQTYREIDCSKGVALFTIALKINKPGEYTIACMEYPNKSRNDLTVWGVLA